MEITSINEYVASTYGEDNIPQDLVEACEIEALYEATKRDVQLKVYFQQAFDSLRNKEWTVDKIDTEIKKIEKCNKIIEEAQKKSIASPKYMKLLSSATYWEDLLKHVFYGACMGLLADVYMKSMALLIVVTTPAASLFAKTLGTLGAATSGVLATGDYLSSRTYDLKTKDGTNKNHWVAYEKLRQENEKALKWLKEERERIKNGTAKKKKLGNIITGKQESTIFDNIDII